MCGICFVCFASCADLDLDLDLDKTSIHNQHCRGTRGPTSPLTNATSVDVIDTARDISRSPGPRSNEDQTEHLFSDSLLHHRGPDVSKRHSFPITENLHGHMQGCVLHLRGDITPQPVRDELGNSLLWNGEVFDGIQVKENENDSQVLFDALVTCHHDDDILRTLQQVHGPWAFVFWQAKTKKLWFGRDIFGRRSLLWHLPSSAQDQIVLSSVALSDLVYNEIPSVGIFSLDFSKLQLQENSILPELTLYPWANCRWPGTSEIVVETKQSDLHSFLYPKHPCCLPITVDHRGVLDSWIPEMNKSLPEANTRIGEKSNDFQLKESDTLEDLLIQISEQRKDMCFIAEDLINVLQSAVEKRVNNLPRNWDTQKEKVSKLSQTAEWKNGSNEYLMKDIPESESDIKNSFGKLKLCDEPLNTTDQISLSTANVALLFSGGLDSSLLAALADRCVPEDEPIDLLNVAFEQQIPVKPQQNCKQKQKRQLKNKKMSPNEEVTSAKSDSSCESKDSINNYAHPEKSGSTNVTKTCEHLLLDKCTESEQRHTEIPQSAQNNYVDTNKEPESHATCLQNPPLHTACDSFSRTSDSVDKENDSCKKVFDPFDVPDRQTGLIALSELNPRRKWNFVEINVTLAELQAFRQSHIYKLIYPLQTVLDDSIGCAVWFAARGHGVLQNDHGQTFVSKARVILCGMAADEQFAGYSRHRATFNTKGWEGLVSELQVEMWRISARNLGRDDRIVTDHGKESRFPFLDETFTQFVSKIPAHMRADLQLPRGVGEKLLLRLCALKLGLLKTASQPKRAIQFGSKIAKLDNRKEKGSDVCDRLT